MRTLASLTVMLIFPSCTLTKQVSLTPTSGPLAKRGITSVPAEFTWNGSGAGGVTVYMPDGEVLNGRYSTIAQGYNTYSTGSAMASASAYGTGGYATGYGSSNYYGRSSSYSNQQFGRALAKGNKGTVITIDYTTSQSAPTSGQGSGFDNRGNKYTLIY